MNDEQENKELRKELDWWRRHGVDEADFDKLRDVIRTMTDTLKERSKEIARLKQQLSVMDSEELKEKVEKFYLLTQLVVDHCEEAAEIRDLARPVLGEKAVDGDSYGVPTVADIVEALVNKLNEANGHIDAAIDTLKQHLARRDDETDKYRKQRINWTLDCLQTARKEQEQEQQDAN